jgi:large repetitive protein
VAVGQYPVVNLGPDQVVASGTALTLTPVVQNGPITNWAWSPSSGLSCNNCAQPVATILQDISYRVKVTTAFGCSGEDTISFKTFCRDAQTFIPNAFTPDGDGINDVLMVRGSGIVTVKSFRIFNRWGELVFERSNFVPNNPAFGWDGRINGIAGGPDVFVYTADVVCGNGTTFTYKGNVSLIK